MTEAYRNLRSLQGSINAIGRQNLIAFNCVSARVNRHGRQASLCHEHAGCGQHDILKMRSASGLVEDMEMELAS